MIPINRNGNCEDDLLGSGGRTCDIQSFGDVKGFNLHPKGWKQTIATDTWTEAAWKQLIKDFDVIPYEGIYDFTQDTPENENATSSTGVLSPIRVAKPQFSFSLDKGGCIHRSLFDKRGKNKWDLSLTFETGILLAVSEDETTVEGFDMGLFDVGTFRLQQGTDPQQTTAMMQLVDAYQFNTKFVFVTWAQLGVNLSKIEGVVQASVTYEETPVAGDTEIIVKVASACNLSDPILGAEAATDWALGGDTAETISTAVYDAEDGTYTLTLSGALTAGETIQPRLTSAAGDNVFEDDGGNLFKGKAKLITIAEATT